MWQNSYNYDTYKTSCSVLEQLCPTLEQFCPTLKQLFAHSTEAHEFCPEND
ncbi:50S ribosomal protein L33 domain protein [Capnocytophaga sp. oral taxon 326 str. F0382]|nr:50S ribosomal protein L33 domain protein [Capnocytophaga sp. oral taxon 326 str. F0382]